MTRLKISRQAAGQPEIFASIQGEGVSVGIPSTFVRLSICNLSCVWCDTRYTWDWRSFDPKTEIVTLSVDDVVSIVEALCMKNVVFTGGEPLLQMSGLEELADRLNGNGHRIEIETNGTVRPSEKLAANVAQWNVSPKLQNSGNHQGKRERADVLTWFASMETAYFKFVVQEPDDLSEVRDFARCHAIASSNILIMPEGRDPHTIQERSKWLVGLCQENKYRYSTRLHVLLWGDERGR